MGTTQSSTNDVMLTPTSDDEDNNIHDSDDDDQQQQQQHDDHPSMLMAVDSSTHIGGFRVMSIKEGSPAHIAGIEPYFDYILALDGIQVSDNDDKVYKAIIDRKI